MLLIEKYKDFGDFILNNKLNKSVTVRFSTDDYHSLADDAERSGTTMADMLRKTYNFYSTHQRIESQIIEMEQRQKTLLIELLSEMLNLSDEQKNEVVFKLVSKGVEL